MDPRDALLATLRDPHVPAAGWWPPAIGWWILGALVLSVLVLLLASLVSRRARRRRALAWQREARTELAALRARFGDGAPPATLLGEASVLARRALLAVAPRGEIAPLHGEAWLRALDAASGGAHFTRGAARRLASAPFERAPDVSGEELASVLDALELLLTRLGRIERDRSPGGGAGARAAGADA